MKLKVAVGKLTHAVAEGYEPREIVAKVFPKRRKT